MKCPKCNTDNPDTQKFCGECATPLPSSKEIPFTKTLETPTEELTRGTTFAGRYEIIEELGKGGMGKVYRVEDKKIKEEVALKLIKPEIAADKKTIERFSNELKMARKIAHRNVCRMYDLGEEKGTHFITMEYVPGEDLKGMIRMVGNLGAGKAISIAKQVCDGLAEAHRLGVVHRDLKPQNIMIDKEGNARIMDFGIARSIKGKGITGAGVMVGTPEYMSPEQAEVKEVDQRSDIYSLGVILYEMVTGRVPFEGETPLGIAMKHKSEIPKDPREFNAQIPEDLSRAIMKCLEKDKEKRFQDADEVYSELDKIERGIPSTERVVPKRKPITTKEITVTFSLKKLFIPALVIIAMVITGLIILRPWSQKDVVPIPTDKPSVAIMYFKNNTGDENFDFWRSALSDSIITDLSQSKFIRVLSTADLYSILRELDLLAAKTYASEDLKEVAAKGGVNHILQGGLSKAGDTFRIDYTLHDMNTGKTIGADRVEGMGEESIFSMVDALTKKIKTSLELSEEQIASDLDKEIGKITTSSPEAYKYYVEGRMYHNQADFPQSIDLMEKAVAIDPDFAMAYRSMGISYSNMGYRSKFREYLEKAVALGNRISDREKYLIQGDLYRTLEKTYDKGIEAYSKLLDLYPEDMVGNNNLAIVFRGLEEWDKAIERYEVLIQAKVENVWPNQGIARIYMAKGLYDKAKEVLEDYLNNFSDNAVIHNRLAFIYLCQRKYDLALSEVDKALRLAPTFYESAINKGDIYLYKGDLIKAELEYQKFLELDGQRGEYIRREKLACLCLLRGEVDRARDHIKQNISWAEKMGEMASKAWSHSYLGLLHLVSGNSDMALKECERVWSIAVDADLISWQRWTLFLKGLIFLTMGSIDAAQRTAAELKELIDDGMNKKAIRYHHHLMGMMELDRQNFSKAIEYFKEAISLLPFQRMSSDAHALFINPLALAYYKSGDLEKAHEEYEKITELTIGRLHYGDIYAKSFYMLGKIYEQQGDKAKAIEHYQKFLDLWKNADPGMAEVEDAKKRLAGLK